MAANMNKSRIRRSMLEIVIFFSIFLHDAATMIHAARGITQGGQSSSPPVKLRASDKHVEIDNGIVKLTLLKPSGFITGVGYRGIKNILEYKNAEDRRGYWDIVWSRPQNDTSFFDTLESTNFKVVEENEDQIEVSFTKTWSESRGEKIVPLNVDKRFIVLRGVSGFYSYAIFEHLEGWPDLNIDEARIAFKLHQDKFNYMVISDNKQRFMPTDNDRKAGQILDYKEAVLIRSSQNPRFKGEVDDKYQYSCDNKDSRVHGWISSNPKVGFWVITPSDEFRAGGPIKPDLTSHAGPTSLAIFFSDHYAGPSFGVKLRNGEPWKKVFGPVFVYLNNADPDNNSTVLWEDAKRQMSEEIEKWPYDFPESRDFPRGSQRGTITGRLMVRDKYINNREIMPAIFAYVGLAQPGNVGSWQDDSKGYQFWTQANETGHFTINGVRAETYNLYAWVPGVIGDYKHDDNVTIRPGSTIEIGELVYDPPRSGPTLWEIGIPDRTAEEFYVPDPAPGLVNKLFINHTEKYRQYGLWDRYTDLYPTEDLIYTVGVSDYSKDWFFAHVNRNMNDSNYMPTTWRIVFDARKVRTTETYTLRLALASASLAELQVWINNPNSHQPHFTTGKIGRDNTIARHGIHGKYWLYEVNLSGYQLVNGNNTIYLKQARTSGPFAGVLYDYIRLEGPGKVNN
ncbi:rhamnogalacturonate lyase family protein [Striga asiatica]|uniref:rhamnogalacturonan endolyase n=1 Tax=Striga asiatica TaxID=4170 RepID=A0A5A7QPV1_STRAF|nr:rhamnogalacturonate lyase family protein [Striga asiatica]